MLVGKIEKSLNAMTKAKLNLTFFASLGGYGGLELQLLKKTEEAINRGHSATIITKPNSKIEKTAKLINLPFFPILNRYKYTDFKAVIKLGNFLKTNKTDALIISQSFQLGTGILARNIFSPDTSIVFFQQMQSGINKKDLYHNWIYKNIETAIVLTNKMKSQLIKSTNIIHSKINVIPLGIDLKKFNSNNFNKKSSRDYFKLPKDSFLIGCIARIEPNKSQITLLKALKEIKIEKSILVFCGNIDNQEYYSNLLAYSKDIGISSKVIFLDFTEDVPMLMNCFDVFILPTLSETYGLVIIEAMASGIPVIAVNRGGVPEIITHKESGFLIEPDSHSKLAEYLETIYTDSDIKNHFVENAFNTIEEKFEETTQTDKFFKVIENTIKERKEIR